MEHLKKRDRLHPQKGFTLIELLVVIAIIGVLTAIGIASFQGAQAKARDTKRKGDLKAIQTALQAYYNDHQAFPICGATTSWYPVYSGSSCLSVLVPNYIKQMPTDPSGVNGNWPNNTSSNHGYSYYSIASTDTTTCSSLGGSGQWYALNTGLENSSDSQTIYNSHIPLWCDNAQVWTDPQWSVGGSCTGASCYPEYVITTP